MFVRLRGGYTFYTGQKKCKQRCPRVFYSFSSLFFSKRESSSHHVTPHNLSLHSLFPVKESERVRICKCDKEERTYFTQVNRSAKKGVCVFVFLFPQVFFLEERRSTSHPEQHLDRTSRSFRPFFVLSHRYVLCYIFPPKKERRIYAQYR